MKVLVACEFSGVVRDAFLAKGHDAVSCDLLPSDRPGPHIQGDVLKILDRGWDLMVAHPPCTHLAVSGARHFKKKQAEQEKALDFVRSLLGAPIPHICVENPVSIISSRIRTPDQIIQPWQFGDPERKTTCLWLKNLPKLTVTHVDGWKNASNTLYMLGPSPDRWKKRSATFPGIAAAMAKAFSSPVYQLTLID